MPRDSFSLAVRVGREIDHVACLGVLFQFLDYLRLVLHIDVLRREIMLHVNAQLGLRQVDYMPGGSYYVIALAEVLLNGFRLRRRLQYYKMRHRVSS